MPGHQARIAKKLTFMSLICQGEGSSVTSYFLKIVVLIDHIHRDVNEDELTNIFSAYGNIVQMNLLKDKITGMPRGVAFVRYFLFSSVCSR